MQMQVKYLLQMLHLRRQFNFSVLSKKPAFAEAMKLQNSGHFRLSNDHLLPLEQGELAAADRILLNRKVAKNLLGLHDLYSAQRYLRQNTSLSTNKLQDKFILTQLLVHSSLKDAMLECKAATQGLTSSSPLWHRFTLLKGTIFLLAGCYPQAKESFRELVIECKDSRLLGMGLNNLAVACWWHKHPSFRDLQYNMELEEGQKYEQQLIDLDFRHVVPLLKKGAISIEGQPELEQFLSPFAESKEPVQKDIFKCQHSGTILLNLHQFLLLNDRARRKQAMLMFRLGLNVVERKQPSLLPRCLVMMGLICSSSGQHEKAEALFQRAIQRLSGTRDYTMVTCLQLYGKMLRKQGRLEQSQNVLEESYKLAEQLADWSNRLNYICMEDLEL